MLKLKSILTVAVLSLVCGFAMAQPKGSEGGPGGPGRPGGPGGERGPRMDRENPCGDFFKAVNATEEQIEKLKVIMKDQKDKLDKWREDNKEKFQAARKAMQEARKSKDKDAIAKAKEQMKSLAEDGKKLREQFQKDLATVLSDEQMEKAKAFFQEKIKNRMHHMRGGGRGGMDAKGGRGGKGGRGDMFKELGLTDDQKAKIKDIMTDARNKMKDADSPQEKREIMEAARKKIDSEVLTDEQKEKLKKMKPQGDRKRGENRRGGMMNPLDGIATPEQMEQAKKIMEDAHKQAAEIMKAARKKINDEVLNEEHRKALQERMEQFKERMKDMQKNRRGGRSGQGRDGRFNRRPGGGPQDAMCGDSCKDGDGPKRDKMRDGKRRRHKDPMMSIMTDEQKAQAKKILDEAREKAKAAESKEEKREIMKAARQKIRKEVLTDEQRKQLKEKGKCKDKDKDAAEITDVDADLIAMMCEEPTGQDEDFLPEGPEFGPMAHMEDGPDGFRPEGPEFGPENFGPRGPEFRPENAGPEPMEFEPPEFDRPAPQFDDMES